MSRYCFIQGSINNASLSFSKAIHICINNLLLKVKFLFIFVKMGKYCII